ncbi:hypothetical protein FN846DRAFT_890019 [Sphaerosporella brunnea]|uniref:Uncharacterized protein n=1 Tax=Sphaerosporella brunnea TaxID=1250544 RepID=A0A5J5EXX1_9PEZI|nr:hypothetical protein FN846DRAFT_890019 [Sphaerosporella brunnea]
MFLPCFLFTLAVYHLPEKLVRNKFLAAFFDGLCGAVIDVIAVITAEILKAGVQGTQRKLEAATQTGSAAVLYVVALAMLYKFTHKYTAILLVRSKISCWNIWVELYSISHMGFFCYGHLHHLEHSGSSGPDYARIAIGPPYPFSRDAIDGSGGVPCSKAYGILIQHATTDEELGNIAAIPERNCVEVGNGGDGCCVKNGAVWKGVG